MPIRQDQGSPMPLRWPPPGTPAARGCLLVIEDDWDIANSLRLHLSDAGYRVALAADGRHGLDLAMARRFDLVVLDLMLPDIDGLEICRTLYGSAARVPILALTARSSEADRVLGLSLGADDYLTKPFSMLEFLARVMALLRRARSGEAQASDSLTLERGALLIDCARHTVLLDGRGVALTAKEFDLLRWFAERPGRVFPRRQLLDAVWGYDSESLEHTVNTHLNRLRSKIEKNPAHPQLLVTVRGAGYKFVEPPRLS